MKKRLYGVLVALICVLCMSVFLSACGYEDHEHRYTEIASERIEPTCTQAGTRFLECKCGEKTTQVIPSLGHDFGEEEDRDIICKRCGRLNTDDSSVKDSENLVYNRIMGNNAYTGKEEVVGLSVAGIDGAVERYIKIPKTHKIKEQDENGQEKEKEYKITAIEAEAFKGCNVQSVYISDNVKSIGDGAFADCASLVGIALPGTLTEMGTDVFSGCTALVKTKYENVNYLGYDANEYFACIGADGDISEFTLHSKASLISEKAFYGNSELKTVVIADGVKAIGEQSFGGCSGIQTAVMPVSAIPYIPQGSLKNVKITSGREIANEAFYGCSTLTVLEIAVTVRRVGADAFTGCDGIEDIKVSTLVVPHIPKANLKKAVVLSVKDSGEKLPDGTFAGCSKLVSVTTDVKTIGKNAFADCIALPSIALSKNTEVIGESAFKNCASLTGISIKVSLKSIGKQAFYGCESLTDVAYSGNIIDWGAIKFADQYSTPLCYGAKLKYKGISESYKGKR